MPNWIFVELFVGGIVCVILAYILPLPQTYTFNLDTFGLALLIGALVEHRFDNLEKKLDGILRASPKADENDR